MSIYLPAGASHKRPAKPLRVYTIANPNEEPYPDASTPSFYPPPPLQDTSLQFPEMPSKPGLKSIPLINPAQGTDRGNSQNPLISRTDNFVKKITAPFSHVRRKPVGNNVPPTTESVLAVYFHCLRDPPDIRPTRPQESITIGPPPPKPTSLAHV